MGASEDLERKARFFAAQPQKMRPDFSDYGDGLFSSLHTVRTSGMLPSDFISIHFNKRGLCVSKEFRVVWF
jgi:hypothetical protein